MILLARAAVSVREPNDSSAELFLSDTVVVDGQLGIKAVGDAPCRKGATEFRFWTAVTWIPLSAEHKFSLQAQRSIFRRDPSPMDP